MIVNVDLGRSLFDDGAAEQRSSAARERMGRERKADAQRMQQAVREQRTAAASSQRLHEARLQLLAFEAEEHSEMRETSQTAVDKVEAELAKDVLGRLLEQKSARRTKPKEQMLPATAATAATGRAKNAAAAAAKALGALAIEEREALDAQSAGLQAAPPQAHQPARDSVRAREGQALDPCHEFDRGWAEAEADAKADEAAGALAALARSRIADGQERTGQAETGRTTQHPQARAEPTRPSPSATPAAARAQASEQVRTQEVHREVGQELSQDIGAALDSLHALAQQRSRSGTAGQADQTRALDDRIEGTLAFLEGYVLDEAGQDAGLAAHSQLAAQLAKAREGMKALKGKPEDDEATTSTGVTGTTGATVNGGSAPSVVSVQPVPQQLPQPAALELKVAVEARTRNVAASRVDGRSPVQTGAPPAAKERGPVRAGELKRLREALDDDDARQDVQQASLNTRRDSVTLPQRVVQSV